MKFLVFYGGLFLFIVGAILRALVWPPVLNGSGCFDSNLNCLALTIRSKRTNKPIHISGIFVPVEYQNTLSASPPEGFVAKSETFTPNYLYDGKCRELLEWDGAIDVAPKQTKQILIPIGNLTHLSGTIRISYETRFWVGSYGSWNFIPFEIAV